MRRATPSGTLLFASALAGLLCLTGPTAARADDAPSIQRDLADLSLGDTLEDIQRIYPPAQEWPVTVEKRVGVKRYRIDRTATKSPAPHVDTMWLGLKHGRLVEIQLIYTAAHTRSKSMDELASDLALTYGNPRSGGGKYWWKDGGTVLRVFNAELPTVKDGGAQVELRTTIQLMEARLFKSAD